MVDAIRILSGSAHPAFAAEVCRHVGVELCRTRTVRFSNENMLVQILENVRETDAFVIQPSCAPVSDGIIELLITIDALKHASARRITAVLPYFPYARSDKKDQPRISITARLMADLLETAGANRVLTMDLHSPQVQGFFDIPFDHLYAAPVLIEHFKKKNLKNLAVVAPDIGSVKMARADAKRLSAALALVDKRRPHPDAVEVMNVIGDVEDKHVVLFDDMVTTARTLTGAASAVKAHGALDVYAGATHAVLVPGARERIEESVIKEVVVTNTVPHDRQDFGPKMHVLDVSDILAEAIRRIHEERSLSSLFI
jgi:ribose-phosphate pyrophosphokinase